MIFMTLNRIYTVLRNKLHTFFLKWKKGINIGKHTSVYYGSAIYCYPLSYKNGGGCTIGNKCSIGCSPIKYHGGMPFPTTLLSDGKSSSIVIGDNSRINGAYIHAEKSIVIGNNCVIASGVNIIDSNGHQVKSSNRTIGRDNPEEIIIGNNVWICMNATILKGTIIGDNSIVTAGSVVKGVIPPDSIVSTNESLIIKKIEQ